MRCPEKSDVPKAQLVYFPQMSRKKMFDQTSCNDNYMGACLHSLSHYFLQG